MKQPTAIPVQASERIQVVDVLRGFAILGILIFNMKSFSGQSFSLDSWTEQLDRAVFLLIDFFVQAKFYSLFSFLFGWGMAVQMRRAQSKDVKFLPLYLRRLLVLLAFGAIHGILIWTGDILTMYAILGFFLVLLFRNRSEKVLLIAVGLSLLTTIILTLPGESMDSVREWCISPVKCLRPENPLPYSLYGTGTYWEITQLRFQHYLTGFWWFPCYFGNVFAMMLLGLYVGKRRIFENIQQHLPFIRTVLWIGLGIGLIFNGIFIYSVLYPITSKYASLIRIGSRTIGAPAFTLFYITGIILLFQRERWRQRLEPLSYVGRMALSNYIFQSILGTLIFYGYGLGLFGATDPTFGLLLTIFIYLIQIRISYWWFEHYQFGPLELLWRTLSYSRRHPFSIKDTYESLGGTPEENRKRQLISLGVVWLLLLGWGYGLFNWSSQLKAGEQVSELELALRGLAEGGSTLAEDDTSLGFDNIPVATPDVRPVNINPGPAAAAGDLSALAAAFDPDGALSQIEILAGDTYKGRPSGSEEGWEAGDYLAGQFVRLGLQPAGDEGGFFQTFPVTYTPLTESPVLTVQGADGTFHNSFAAYQDFSPAIGYYSGSGLGGGQVVWVNKCSQDDFDGLNVVGKIVLCHAGSIQSIGRNAAENGAAGLLLLTDPLIRPAEYLDANLPVWIPEPVPTFYIYPRVAETLLAGSDVTITDLSLIFEPFELDSSVQMEISAERGMSCPAGGCLGRNVLGVIPGRDPAYADQVIILGANYDHLGENPDGTVWPGANDNASGVSVLLEIAHSWREQAYVPRVTMLFVAWDAKEQGSLGAEYYVRHPRYPFENTITVIQLDKVGAGDGPLQIDGPDGVEEHIRAAAESLGVDVAITNNKSGDHLPFVEAGVPAHLITWAEEDNHVHLPTDTLESVDRERLDSIGQITSLTILGLAEGQAEIEELLTRRAEAVLRDDLAAFLNTSVSSQRENDRFWFRDASALSPIDCQMDISDLRVAGNTARATVSIRLVVPTESGQTREISLEMPTIFKHSVSEWKWAGPDLVILEPLVTNEEEIQPETRFTTEHPADKTEGLDDLADAAAEQYTQIANLLGLSPEVDGNIQLFASNEHLRASTAMSIPSNENAYVLPNTIKLTYSAEVSNSERLQSALAHLLLVNTGVTEEFAPWLWEGLPLVLQAEGDPITLQSDLLVSLQTALSNESSSLSPERSWAAVDYLRERRGWVGLGQFITELGQACRTYDCESDDGIDAALSATLGADAASFENAWRGHWQTRLNDMQANLDAVLETRVEAILARDRVTFLQTVDRGTPNLLQEETDWFNDLTVHPVEEFSLSAVPLTFLEDGNLLASVTLNYQFRNVDQAWGSGRVVMPVLFTTSDDGYRWAGPVLDSLSGRLVHVRYSDGQTALAESLLADADNYYTQLAEELNIPNPKQLTINLYENEDAYHSSIALSYPPSDWNASWSADGHSVKLLLNGDEPVESYRPALARQLTHQLLIQMGVDSEWLLTGGSSYLSQNVDAGAGQKAAAEQLYYLSRGIEEENIFDLSDFPPLYRLTEDEFKIALPQAWDSVRYIAETYGRDTLMRLLTEQGRGQNLDAALRATTRLSQGDFESAWEDSLTRGHASRSWVDTATAFDESRAMVHTSFLTSPLFTGRQAGSPGSRIAADYIAEQFALYGLETSMQSFPIIYQAYLSTPRIELMPHGSNSRESFIYREDFLMLQNVDTNGTLTGELIWVLDESYTGMDLTGKVVVRKPTLPIEDEITLATAHGASALILQGDKNNEPDLLAKYPSQVITTEGEIPVIELTRDGFDRLLELSGQTPAGINNTPPALPLGIRTEVSIHLSAPETVETANVFGFLPGSDPVLGEQIIILGAHYDHVGNDPERSYSGANDNASGVGVMLEIARLWQSSGYRPDRSVLFAAWGAQEPGELGSGYYVENPLYPLEDTIAMVQMDAVGGGGGYHLGGEGARKDEGLLLFSIEKANDLVGGRLQLSLPEESSGIPPEMLFSPAMLYDRTSMERSSDHAPFRKAGIPSLLITWRESDENNLSDEIADEVEPDRLYTTGKIIALTLMMLAR